MTSCSRCDNAAIATRRMPLMTRPERAVKMCESWSFSCEPHHPRLNTYCPAFLHYPAVFTACGVELLNACVFATMYRQNCVPKMKPFFNPVLDIPEIAAMLSAPCSAFRPCMQLEFVCAAAPSAFGAGLCPIVVAHLKRKIELSPASLAVPHQLPDHAAQESVLQLS